MNLVRAELMKIATLRATWISLFVAGCGEALRWRLLPVYAIAAIGAQALGSEYRAGHLRLTLVAAPRRSRLYAAKLTAALGGAGAAALLMPAADVLLRRPAAPTSWLPGVLLTRPGVPTLWLLSVLLSGVAAGLATITRGALAPLTGLGLAALASMAGLLPPFRRFLPHDAMTDALAGRSRGLLVVAWAAVSALAGGLTFTRRDA